jgi:DNA-binding transcriptional regulator YbjK
MAFRLVPAGQSHWLDLGEETFGSELDDEVWDEVLLQIESQRRPSRITDADVEVEQTLRTEDASTGQSRSLRHAGSSEYARAGIPDLEDIMEEFRELQQMLPAEIFEHEDDAAFDIDIEGMSRLMQSD